MSAIPHEECRQGAYLPFLGREAARRWINYWSLWRMASVMPDLRLPSQPQDITATWPVPNYTASWRLVNNLPKVVIWKRNGQDLNPQPFESLVQRSNHYATRPHFEALLSNNSKFDLWTDTCKLSKFEKNLNSCDNYNSWAERWKYSEIRLYI